VSSLAGRICVPFGGWYSASKHAMEALTDALRLELGAFGIDVISIMPGPVETEFVPNIQTPIKDAENAPLVYKQIGEALRSRNSGHRHGSVSAEQVASVIFRAASAERPKTRYTITTQDRMGLITKKLLSDRTWDKLIASFYKFSKVIKPSREK
jgi:NAD(P)-dependent dehydrogenase (short-subunit alcohol dehydrogenase family)